MRSGVSCWMGVALAAVALMAVALPGMAQNRPLSGPDAEIVPADTLRVQLGFDFLQDLRYPLSGLSGDQINVGVLDLRLGLGDMVEVELSGAVRQFLQINSRGPSLVSLDLTESNSTHDVGDFSLLTKVRILGEGERRPALAARFGFTMPNTNQARGIGNNSMGVSVEAIAQRHIGRLRLFGSLGLAILSAPNEPHTQNDELLYGLGIAHPVGERLTLVGEVAGRYSTREIDARLAGTESRAQWRFGMQVMACGIQWDAAGIAGVYRNDPRIGLTFGISRDFRLFGRGATQ